jgi:hypothetical protein
MSKADSEMDGTICKQCNRPINEHLPEELEECTRKIEFKKLKENDMR